MLSNKPFNPLPTPQDNRDGAFLERNADALRQIEIFADLSEGFTIGFVQVALERDRARILQAIIARSEPLGVQWIELGLEAPQLRYPLAAIQEALQSIAIDPKKKPVLAIWGWERAIGGYADYPPLLTNLNLARDRFANQLPYPMLIFLPSYALTRLARFAPDFWAWKSFEVRLASDLPPPEQAKAELIEIPSDRKVVPVLPTRFNLLFRLLEDYKQPSLTRADLLYQLGEAYESHIDYARAETAYQEALNLYQQYDRKLNVANSLTHLALLYREQGRFSEAESFFLRSLSIRESRLVADHPFVATSLNNLALLYNSQGRTSEAEPLYLRSQSIVESRLGADHPDVATILNNLASLYREQGRYSEAEPLYLRSQSIFESQLGVDHPHVATSLNNLADLYYSQGRYSEAEPLLLRSLSIRESRLVADHPDVATTLNNLAELYRSQGRYSEAEPLFLRSQSIVESRLGADHPHVAASLNNLALLYRAQGRYSEAEPLFLRSLSIDENQLGADHPYVATDLNNLALLYKSQGRYSEAEPLFLRSLQIREQRLGVDHPTTARVRKNYDLFLAEWRSQGK